ncbi:potassium/proton antiporter [Chthonobacter albigriseus]|uniref:potassium/proton antiporter n=1 Tax=Chthonobacter albigriseus TaxID=1683161 RepID=UPI0015EF2E88|nr:potassium/proton antiporter [Chthonobacter albigriseus]
MEEIASANFGLAFGAMLVLGGILSSLVASRFGTPLLLVFLIIGMLAGEDGPGGIVFDNYQATYLIGSCALAIILFDGGLRTRLSVVRDALAPALTLATVGVALTATIVGAFTVLAFSRSWTEGLLLGAIVASTDAAAVFFLMKTGGLQLRHPIGPMLEIESGSNDPIAVFLTLVITQFAVAAGDHSALEIAATLLRQAVLGAALGLAAGFLSVTLLNRLNLLNGLHPLMVIAVAIAVFGITALLDGSGFLAVYIAGLVVGNRPVRAFPSIVAFHDTATWLCQIVMFLVLGLLVTPTTLVDYVVPGLIIATFLIVVGRPAAVYLCLRPFGFSAREITFVSWVGLRGAVSIFLAAIPTLAGVDGAEVYFNVAFFVVMVSLVVQGWTIAPVARGLGMALRRPAAATNRIEIDLPGQSEKELVGYPIVADSFITLRPSAVPGWLRPVLVVREGEVRNATEVGALRTGDYAYFLVSNDRVTRLDRLFAPLPPDAVNAARQLVFGEFPIAADAPIGEVAAFYGLEVPDPLKDTTVAQAFRLRHGGKLRAGSRIDLGPWAAIVARTVEEGEVVRAGLRIDEVIDLGPNRPPVTVGRLGTYIDALAARFGGAPTSKRDAE